MSDELADADGATFAADGAEPREATCSASLEERRWKPFAREICVPGHFCPLRGHGASANNKVSKPPASSACRLQAWTPPRAHAVKASVRPPEMATSHSRAAMRAELRGTCFARVDPCVVFLAMLGTGGCVEWAKLIH